MGPQKRGFQELCSSRRVAILVWLQSSKHYICVWPPIQHTGTRDNGEARIDAAVEIRCAQGGIDVSTAMPGPTQQNRFRDAVELTVCARISVES